MGVGSSKNRFLKTVGDPRRGKTASVWAINFTAENEIISHERRVSMYVPSLPSPAIIGKECGAAKESYAFPSTAQRKETVWLNNLSLIMQTPCEREKVAGAGLVLVAISLETDDGGGRGIKKRLSIADTLPATEGYRGGFWSPHFRYRK